MRKTIFRTILVNAFLLFVLVGCSGGTSTDGAALAVETYFQALIDRDLNDVSNIVCLAWEEQAYLEFDSYSAVTSKLEGLDCQVTSTEGDYAVVECRGTIIANYGGEDQEFHLQDNRYHTLFEDGEWRMCGFY
jgi:hypothetical protein